MKKLIVDLLTFSITLSISDILIGVVVALLCRSVWWFIITEIVLLLIGALFLMLTTGKAIHHLEIKKD